MGSWVHGLVCLVCLVLLAFLTSALDCTFSSDCLSGRDLPWFALLCLVSRCHCTVLYSCSSVCATALSCASFWQFVAESLFTPNRRAESNATQRIASLSNSKAPTSKAPRLQGAKLADSYKSTTTLLLRLNLLNLPLHHPVFFSPGYPLSRSLFSLPSSAFAL